MAVYNSELVEIKKVTELISKLPFMQSFFSHCGDDGVLYKATLDQLATFLAPYITAVGGSGFVATTGTVLPPASAGKFTIVGAGTFTQATGGNVVTTELLNILGSSATSWSLVTAIGTSALVSKDFSDFGGRFATVAEANAAIPNTFVNGKNQRSGKIVFIGDPTNYTAYWWKGGYANESLVKFSGGTDSWAVINSATGINFNLVNGRKLEITEGTPIIYNNARYLIPAQSLDIPAGSHFLLRWDSATGAVEVIFQASYVPVADKILFAGIVIENGRVYANGLDNYLVNGKPFTDSFGYGLKGENGFYNASYNLTTGGVILFATKTEARTAVPLEIRKRGMIFTYRLSTETFWRTEQYYGSTNPDWNYTDAAYIDLTKKNTSGLIEPNTATPITYDKASQILAIPSCIISTDDGRRINVAATSLSVPIGANRLVSSLNGVLSFQNIDAPIPFDMGNEKIALGSFLLQGAGLDLISFGATFPLGGKTLKDKDERIAYVNNYKSHINFDLPSRLIKFTGGAIVDSSQPAQGRINLPIVNVAIPSSIQAGVVLYNRDNNTLVVRNQLSTPLPNHFILFTYRYEGSYASFDTSLKSYSVNGIPVGDGDLRQTYPYSIDNFAIPYNSVPVQPGVGATDTFNVNTLTSTMLYGFYETIRTANSGITRTLLGTTDSGYEVYKYKMNFNDALSGTRRKPKIFICSGTHGGEILAVYTAFLLFKELATNPNNNEMINSLRRNFDFVFIPLSNPFALNVGRVNNVGSVRWNHNGVDINRNYETLWAEYDGGAIGSQTYKGTAAFSEKESQFVRDAVLAEKDNLILLLDCHNFGNTPQGTDRYCVWFPCGTSAAHNIASAFCDRIDFEFKKRYSYLPKSAPMTYASKNFSEPMLQLWANNMQIISATMETDASDVNNPNGYNYNSNCMTRSLETYINAVYSFGKAAVDLNNTYKTLIT